MAKSARPSPLPFMASTRRAANAAVMAAIWVGSPSFAMAQSLFESVQAGLISSPSVEARRLQLAAQGERRIQAYALRRATIQGEASGGLSASKRNQQGFLGPTTVRNFQTAPAGVSLSVEQPIYTGGRYDAARILAEAQIRQAEAQLRSAELEVIQGIVIAWADVRRDLAIIETRRETINAFYELLQGAQERFRLGEATITQAAQAEARLSSERAALAVAQANLLSSLSNFERFTGTNGLKPSDQGILPELPESLETALDRAGNINPELISARLEEDIARARVREIEVDSNSRIALRATVSSDRDQGFQGSRNNNAQVEFRYTVPLWTGGAAPSRTREAVSLAGAARMRALDVDRLVKSRVTTAWGRQVSSRASIVASQQQVSAAKLALKGAQAEFLYGLGDQLNVLNQQTELASAQISLIQSERDELVAHFGVLIAIGSLDAASFDSRPQPSAFMQSSDPAIWEEPLIKVQKKLDQKTRQIERTRQRAVRRVLGPEE